MEFKNSKVSDELVPEGVDQLYQGHPVKSETITTEELASRAAEQLKMEDPTVRNIIAAFGNQINKAIKEGNRPVFDGVFSTRFTVTGSFDSEDAAWDPSRNSLELAFITLDPVKSSIAGIVPTNVLSKIVVQLLGAQDATTYEQGALTLGHTLLAQGKGLKINAANTDEGIFLIKGSTGTEYRGTITGNTAGTIDATFDSTMPVGEDYTLVVRSRNGNGKNRSLVTAKIADFVVKAAA